MTKSNKQTSEKPEWVPLPDELDWDDVGGRLLANIARGMYSPQGVLREYVQNAVDAYKDLETPSEDHKIIITPTKNSLSIQDFGVGMDDKGIREAKKIAVSTKSDYDDRVGFRGIGIWAGLPACKKLIVDSTKEGEEFRYRLAFDFEGIMQHLDDNINIKDLVDPRYHIERHAAEKNEHYTRVTLEGITDGYLQLLDVIELKRIGSQVLPATVDPGFQHYAALMKMLETWPTYFECRIFIQTPAGPEEVFRKFPEDKLEPPEEKTLVSDQGVELARAWFCRTKKTSLRLVSSPAVRGFPLRVKNFAVGEVNMFSAEQGYSYNIHEHQELKTSSRLSWFCGEIHVTNNDIKPNTPRDDLEREQAARLFIEQLRGFYKDRIVEAGAYSEFNPFRNALEDAEDIIAKTRTQGSAKKPVNVEEARSLLNKLSEAANKAKGDSDDQSKKLFKQLLRQPWFKDRCSKAINALKKIVPAPPTTPGGAGKPASAGTNGAKDGQQSGDSGGAGKKPKPTEAEAKPNSNNGEGKAPKEDLALNVEELVSGIFDVLERNLGDDYEDLPRIEEEIQQVVARGFPPMPKNRFPDTREKRELRRRDLRRMKELAEIVGGSLDYCGLPSVEFLDVVCWQEVIKSVTAFENDPEALADMQIEKDRLQFPFPVELNPGERDNMLVYLINEQYCFGLYNLDLYGGLVYQSRDKECKTTNALRQVFSQQAKNKQSFILIATFNVRDFGATEYHEFLGSVRDGLSGRRQSAENIRAHDQNQTTRLKLCFPFFCWQQAHPLGLEQIICEATVYQSSATMVHFFQAFRYVGGALPEFAPVSKVIEVANAPLYEIKGQVRRKQCEFPQVL